MTSNPTRDMEVLPQVFCEYGGLANGQIHCARITFQLVSIWYPQLLKTSEVHYFQSSANTNSTKEGPPRPPPPKLNPHFRNSESRALIMNSSIPCISDQRIQLLNQPNSQYHIHINSRDKSLGRFGKNIQSSGTLYSIVKTSCRLWNTI
jgi:hypothetical protein